MFKRLDKLRRKYSRSSALMLSAAALAFASFEAYNAHESMMMDAQLRAFNSFERDISLQDNAELYALVSDQEPVETLSFLRPVHNVHIKAARFLDAEQQCLADAIYYEARSESQSGQMAVAEVVLNRVKSKHYPSTICGVVYQGSGRDTGCQFSFACDGSMDIAPQGKAWDKALSLANYMQYHNPEPITRRATHYHTVDVNPVWSSNLHFDRQVGYHRFYRFKFIERPVPSEPILAAAPPI